MRAERLVALLFTLQTRRSATMAQLADALGVSERTMHRDIAALQSAGVPVWTEPGRYGGVRLVEGWRTRLDGLTAREAVAIFAVQADRALADLGLGTAMTAAHAKVLATLPQQLQEQAQHIAQRFHLDAPAWFKRPDETEHLATVAQAVWEQRRLTIGYGGRSSTVEPLGLVLKAGVWYLAANLDTVRTYRVSRITATERQTEHFERPENFDLADWWQESATQFEQSLETTKVRLKLTTRGLKALPHFIEADIKIIQTGEEWHEIELTLESPEIAAGQLLALGTEVEIIEPSAARKAFREAARRMAERHR